MAKIDYLPRAAVSAKFLLAPPPGETVIPDGFKITQLTARRASGAYRARSGGTGHAQTSAALCNAADRRPIKSLAYKGW